jgi:putative hydrolase of HD superfamily
MLNPKLSELIFSALSIQRWNDYPRIVKFVELDKQTHKFIIAFLLGKIEVSQGKQIDFLALIEAGVFEFLRRVVVIDIRPDIFRVILKEKRDEVKLVPILLQDGSFLSYIKQVNF